MVGGGWKRRPGARPQILEKTVDVKKNKFCEADVSKVENHYKLSLPEDFYHFWKFCEELDSEKPAGILLMNFLYMLV
uniref:Histone PARylation factor 1 n=1 Tax=Nomascus leucogenys TaxID=61853 RepID=A0A2I3HM78_NOMLE